MGSGRSSHWGRPAQPHPHHRREIGEGGATPFSRLVCTYSLRKYSVRKILVSEVEGGLPGSTPLPKGFSNTRGTPQKLHSSDIFSNVSFHFFTFFSTRAAGATPLHAYAPHERCGGRSNWIYRLSPLSFFGHVGGRGPVQQ